MGPKRPPQSPNHSGTSAKRARKAAPPSQRTMADEIFLNATTSQEITMWKRFHRRFNDTPLSVLDGMTIEVAPDKKLDDEQGDPTIDNTNWTKAFCEEMNHLICIPFFQDQPGLLRYAIRRAVFARVGGDYPDPSEITLPRNHDFVDYLLEHIPGLEDDEDIPPFLLGAATKFFGRGRPSHSGFVAHIENASKQQAKPRGRHATQELSGVTVADITTIVRAWDMYALLRENEEELKTVDQYLEAAKKRRDGPSKEEILGMKKAWIIKSKSATIDAEVLRSSPDDDPFQAPDHPESGNSSDDFPTQTIPDTPRRPLPFEGDASPRPETPQPSDGAATPHHMLLMEYLKDDHGQRVETLPRPESE